jgi:AcrR family transcriptional regulator
MSTRMTRKQTQAHTRSSLMRSAARVFAHRGLEHGSIDEVAEDAGFTKGAFYANFRSKEELFLAMLDERFAERVEEIDELLANDDDLLTQVREGGASWGHLIAADPEWQRLFFEFAAYAARNEEFREELATRYRSLREHFTELYRRRAERLAVPPPIPLELVAMMTCTMANGVGLEQLIEPDAVPPEMFGSMLEIFFAGLAAIAGVDRDRAGVASALT